MRALIVVVLALEACGGAYVYRRTLGPPGDFSMPAECRIEVFTEPPVQIDESNAARPPEQIFVTPYGWAGYWEVGVIEFRGHPGREWPTRDFKRFREWVAPTVCKQGGSAIAARFDADGYYLGGTVLRSAEWGGDFECGTSDAEMRASVDRGAK